MGSAEEQTKECTRCGQEKPLSGFYKHKMRRFGVRSQCKVCVSEYKKQHYQENRDKILERQKQHHQENRDKILERQKQYHQKNKDKISARKKQYYQENRDKKLEYVKQYQQENKDKISARMKQYRQKNKDKISEYKKQYRQKNQDKVREREKQYRQKNQDKVRERNKRYRQNLPSMIYEIHNTITKQIYVGQTSQGRIRWSGHKAKLRKGIHTNPQFQKDWDKWGKDAFRFNVVEELPCDFNKEQLLEKEAALMLEHISNGAKLYNEDIPE
jgi:hypothetical protein